MLPTAATPSCLPQRKIQTCWCFALTIRIVGEAVMKITSNENNLSLTSKLFLCILNVRIKSCLTSNYWRNKGRSFSLFFYVTTVLPIAHASNMGNNSILTLPITSPKHVIFFPLPLIFCYCFSLMVLKFEWASGSPGNIVKTNIAGAHSQSFWFSRTGMQHKNLYV